MKKFLYCVHADTVPLTRTIVAVVTGRRQRRISRKLTTGFAANEEQVMQKIRIEKLQHVLCDLLSTFT